MKVGSFIWDTSEEEVSALGELSPWLTAQSVFYLIKPMDGSPVWGYVRDMEKRNRSTRMPFFTVLVWKAAADSLHAQHPHFHTPRHILLLGARSGENLAEGIAWVRFCYPDNLLFFCNTYKASVFILEAHSPPTEAKCSFPGSAYAWFLERMWEEVKRAPRVGK